MSMTLATAWVRKGVAAEFPRKYEVDEVELSRIEKLSRLQLQDAQQDLIEVQIDENDDDDDDDSDGGDDDDGGEMEMRQSNNSKNHEENSNTSRPQNEGTTEDLKEYNLSDYDDDGPDEDGEKFAMFGNVRSLAYHAPGEEDPYLTLPEAEVESDDEREELQILRTDNLILAAQVEDEVAHLEILVYEDTEDNIYVHHDIMLPAIPLCVEWLDMPVGKDNGAQVSGNFAAIGTMSPEIEIWDLDVVDSMYPSAILGQQIEDRTMATDNGNNGVKKNKKQVKKKKKPKVNDEYHVDAVLALAANRQHRNLLASASADKTVKLWDLNTGKCAKSYSMHTGKVCALDWHPIDSTVLLSGSYDRTVVVTDMRAPDAVAPRWTVEADVETVRWDPHDPNFFYVTTEAGMVHYFDKRNPSESSRKPIKPVWTLQAHDGAVSAFDINTTIPGYIATGSDDRRVKLWSIIDDKPSMVVSRNFDVGRVFSAKFAPDGEVAFRLSVAGSKGQVQVWDTSTNASIRNVFAGRVKLPDNKGEDKIVKSHTGDDEDESEDDDEDDDETGGAATENAEADGWESMDED